MVAGAEAGDRAPSRGIAGDLTRETWQRPWYA